MILVALMVLLVPELLTGPIRSAPRAAAVASSAEEPPLRSYTINLADDTHSRSAAATASGPQQPTSLSVAQPAAAESPPPASSAAPRAPQAPPAAPPPDAPPPPAAGPPRRAAPADAGEERAGERRSGERSEQRRRGFRRVDGAARQLRQPHERRTPGAAGQGRGLQGERLPGQLRTAAVPGAGRPGARPRGGDAAGGEVAGRGSQWLDRAEVAGRVTRCVGNACDALVQFAPRAMTAITPASDEPDRLPADCHDRALGDRGCGARFPARGSRRGSLGHRPVPRLALLRSRRAAPGRPHVGFRGAALGGPGHYRAAGAAARRRRRCGARALRAAVDFQRHGPAARLRLWRAARLGAARRVRHSRPAAAPAGG